MLVITIIQPGQYKIFITPELNGNPEKLPKHPGFRSDGSKADRWTTPLTCTKTVITTNLHYGTWRFQYIPEYVHRTQMEVPLVHNMGRKQNVHHSVLQNYLTSGSNISKENKENASMAVIGITMLLTPPGFYDVLYNGNLVKRIGTPLTIAAEITCREWMTKNTLKMLKIDD